ncbi:response regulator transcription factor [Flaviaesturariibacter terrae]
MDKPKRVLLAEDDEQLGLLIREGLEDEGYEVVHCPDGNTAWNQFQKELPDICLLDVNLPGRDGFTLAKKIRQRNDVVPILFLTAKSMEEDKLQGFSAGGDDYITKPFSMKELLSRMQVFLRRTGMLLPQKQDELRLGKLRFLPGENRILNGPDEILLTQKETQLLEFFCSNPGKILRREDILLHVWGKNDYFLGRSMDVFITKIRKHLKLDPSVQLETIPQSGYRLHLPS